MIYNYDYFMITAKYNGEKLYWGGGVWITEDRINYNYAPKEYSSKEVAKKVISSTGIALNNNYPAINGLYNDPKTGKTYTKNDITNIGVEHFKKNVTIESIEPI